ncbi:MAG: TadE/TadG family protein [Variibacter sp.]|nr:TadE/TadG family protein [Variibacter sp.]
MLAKQFFKDRRANVAPIFALAIVPVVGLVGAAVDYSRASAIRSEMQGALDATALMLSKEAAGLNGSQLSAKADAYFKALFNRSEVQNITITASQTNSGGSTLTVDGSGTIPTSFTKLLGFSDLTFKSSSTVKWGSTKLRVALALDNTGSMANAGKMAALKAATKNLLDILQAAAKTPGDVQVSIVPFAKDVNVGANYYTAEWLDWSDWDEENGEDVSTKICTNGKGKRKKCTTSTTWVPADHKTWNGCVTDRAQDYDVRNTLPTVTNKDTLFVAEQYDDCPTALLPLTYDWAALSRKVDEMTPAGNTNITIGLAWAWQTLTPGAPLNPPPPPPDTQQIIILLTDGDNTENRFSTSQGAIDFRTKKACENVKAAGIQIYTVLVMDGNASLLKACASKAEMYFGLTSANQLVSTFNQIGTNLAKLRIAK